MKEYLHIFQLCKWINCIPLLLVIIRLLVDSSLSSYRTFSNLKVDVVSNLFNALFVTEIYYTPCFRFWQTKLRRWSQSSLINLFDDVDKVLAQVSIASRKLFPGTTFSGQALGSVNFHLPKNGNMCRRWMLCKYLLLTASEFNLTII